jgi:hypothetical protein
VLEGIALPSPPLSRCLQVLQKDIHDVKLNYVSFFNCTLYFQSFVFSLFGMNEDFIQPKERYKAGIATNKR